MKSLTWAFFLSFIFTVWLWLWVVMVTIRLPESDTEQALLLLSSRFSTTKELLHSWAVSSQPLARYLATPYNNKFHQAATFALLHFLQCLSPSPRTRRYLSFPAIVKFQTRGKRFCALSISKWAKRIEKRYVSGEDWEDYTRNRDCPRSVTETGMAAVPLPTRWSSCTREERKKKRERGGVLKWVRGVVFRGRGSERSAIFFRPGRGGGGAG
ncbi:hypothetical protein QBC41DRAFT_321407 [Cercophora samala]|uniref:Uncharacterized protein n=1 Tax=Cercophora samala TaxID=330535 RepID=A0AA39ZDN8_9PEZI|nr:hypothetical protein QBC41DRAFT_321407 [Cercophora samala]